LGCKLPVGLRPDSEVLRVETGHFCLACSLSRAASALHIRYHTNQQIRDNRKLPSVELSKQRQLGYQGFLILLQGRFYPVTNTRTLPPCTGYQI